MSLDKILATIAIPDDARHVSISRPEAEFIFHLVTKQKPNQTLEVGLAHGLSAAVILSANEGRHSCMDPYQTSTYNDLALNNLESLELSHRLDFYEGFAHEILPRFLNEDRIYDFAFIDGGHLFDQTLVSFFYIDLLLSTGGFVLLHDAWMRSTRLVSSFINRNRLDYKKLKTPCRNLVLFQKIGKSDDREWDHFREFYTLRSLFSQMLVSSWLKR